MIKTENAVSDFCPSFDACFTDPAHNAETPENLALPTPGCPILIAIPALGNNLWIQPPFPHLPAHLIQGNASLQSFVPPGVSHLQTIHGEQLQLANLTACNPHVSTFPQPFYPLCHLHIKLFLALALCRRSPGPPTPNIGSQVIQRQRLGHRPPLMWAFSLDRGGHSSILAANQPLCKRSEPLKRNHRRPRLTIFRDLLISQGASISLWAPLWLLLHRYTMIWRTPHLFQWWKWAKLQEDTHQVPVRRLRSHRPLKGKKHQSDPSKKFGLNGEFQSIADGKTVPDREGFLWKIVDSLFYYREPGMKLLVGEWSAEIEDNNIPIPHSRAGANRVVGEVWEPKSSSHFV
ncbi:uncharacterized protein LOC116516831 [Thamnophis elegans]|uniref:uncharacterized protein LOC116516831 n=1 Tax=Thamnophis elegans TaxID=35005 RepID=UPI0013765F09|nr:uncharacterized protein LOC116516831 [Thamnophis elegans]